MGGELSLNHIIDHFPLIFRSLYARLAKWQLRSGTLFIPWTFQKSSLFFEKLKNRLFFSKIGCLQQRHDARAVSWRPLKNRLSIFIYLGDTSQKSAIFNSSKLLWKPTPLGDTSQKSAVFNLESIG